jgi:hypothetical protein
MNPNNYDNNQPGDQGNQPAPRTDRLQTPAEMLAAQAPSDQLPQQGFVQQPQSQNDALYGRVVTGETGSPRKSKKKWVLLGVAMLVLLLAGGGFVFAYYLPNKPENVWKTSLTRTGDGLKNVTTAVTEKDKLNSFKRSHITASGEYKSKDKSYLVNFKSIFDDSKADGSVDLIEKVKDQPDRTLFGIKLLSELQKGHTFPNVYVQLSGLKQLGVDQMEATYPGLSEYDGKWIAIEEEYLRSLTEQVTGGVQTTEPQQDATKKGNPVTSDDIAAFARTVSEAISEYVLTADATKGILEQRSFVGKETVEDIKTYHYKAGINKPHAKEFCKVLTEQVAKTELYKKMYSDAQTREQNSKTTIENCQKSVDDMKQDTFDVWVDTKYKLIHKIRVTDPENKDIYTELGQNYQGGDKLALFVKLYNGKEQTDGQVTLDTNLKTMETKASLAFKSTKKENPYEVSATLEAKPMKEEIKVEKPAGAVPIKDIMDRYGIDPAGLLLLYGMGGQPVTQTEITEGSTPLYLN